MNIKVADVSVDLKNDPDLRFYEVEKPDLIISGMDYDFLLLSHEGETEIINTSEIVKINISKTYYKKY